jgi:hypothetical protein
VKESLVTNPATLFDELAVHQRDLACWPAEGYHADLRPYGQGFA